jgi:lipopolysaccharide transport system permease protein
MNQNETLTTRIRPQRGLKFVDVGELVRYKDLLFFLSLRGIKTRYAQSVLGVGWAIVQPIVTTLVFTIVFGRLAKVSSDGTPYFLFSLAAMVPWMYFSNTLTEASNSLIMNASMISKVYFPRIVLPLSAAISKALDFFIGLLILVIVLLVNGYNITWSVTLFPLMIIILLMTSLGLGMLLSAMAVQYRDIKHALTFMTQLLLYTSPVVYPTSNVPKQFQFWYALNPMVGVIEGCRSIFLHTPFPWEWLAESLIVSFFLFVGGALYFRKMERIFSDVA